MNLEITKDERILILRCLFAETPLHDPEVKALANRLMELRDGNGHAVPVPLESNGAQRPDMPRTGAGKAEQLPSGVSGRPQSGNEPQRPPQGSGVTYMSTGKYDRSAVEQITVTIDRITRKETETGPRLDLLIPVRGGRGFSTATCWDEDLFVYLKDRAKQESVLYVVHKGKYTNVVGLKG
jgi:hypothetical protein